MQITLVHNSGVASSSEIINFDGTLLDFLIDEFGEHGASVPYACFDENSKLIGGEYEELNRRYEKAKVVVNPAADPTTWLLVASLALSAASFVLIKPPRVSNLDEPGASRASGSPNNSLTSRANQARIRQRIPDIFGTVRAYPDLIAPSHYRYAGGVKLQTEVFCVGMGYYLLNDFRAGETSLEEFEGVEIETFGPGEAIPNLQIVKTSSNVKNLLVPASNNNVVDFSARFSDLRFSFSNVSGVLSDVGDSNSFSIFKAGERIRLVNTEFEYLIGQTTVSDTLDGIYVINSVSTGGSSATISLLDPQDTNSNWLLLPAGNQLNLGANTLVESSGARPVGEFRIPGENYSSVEVDIEAPRGIARGANLNEELSIQIEIKIREYNRQSDALISETTLIRTLRGSDRTPKFYTFDNDIADPANNYATIEMERLTATLNNEPSVDEIRWTRAASRKTVDGSDTLGTQRIRIKMRADERNADIEQRQFNVLASRRTVTYDVQGGFVIGSMDLGVNLNASSKFADILLGYFSSRHLLGRNLGELDIAGLYEIQTELDGILSGDLGQFNFTFDSNSLTAEEELAMIADAARCYIVRRGSQYEVRRDREELLEFQIVTIAHKEKDDVKTVTAYTSNANDGVQLNYFDFEAQTFRTYTLPDQLPGTTLPNAINPLTLEVPGISNRNQAWNRATYEFNKMRYQRVFMRSTVAPTIGTLPLNTKVLVHDLTRPAGTAGMCSGEILEIDGNVYKTREVVEFIDGVDHWIYFTQGDGGILGPYAANPVADNKRAFSLEVTPGLDSVIVSDLAIGETFQRGTTFLMYTDEVGKQNYLLQKMTPRDDHKFTCEFINYDSRFFQNDYEAAPL